jgi:hypothetical protein
MIKYILAFLLVLLLTLMQRNPSKAQSTNSLDSVENKIPKKDISPIAHKVLLQIKNNDFKKLSLIIHPKKGLRFEPYVEQNWCGISFSTKAFKKAYASSKKYIWGHYDGSGEPIRLSFGDYYKNFIYAKDYNVIAPKYYTTQSIPQKYSADAADIAKSDWVQNYPHGIVAYYYYPNPAQDMDWSAIGLVFEKLNNKWYLVAILRDAWRI